MGRIFRHRTTCPLNKASVRACRRFEQTFAQRNPTHAHPRMPRVARHTTRDSGPTASGFDLQLQ